MIDPDLKIEQRRFGDWPDFIIEQKKGLVIITNLSIEQRRFGD